MPKYSANARFVILEFEADNADDAHDKINQLFDELGELATSLDWDDVDWTVEEEV